MFFNSKRSAIAVLFSLCLSVAAPVQASPVQEPVSASELVELIDAMLEEVTQLRKQRGRYYPLKKVASRKIRSYTALLLKSQEVVLKVQRLTQTASSEALQNEQISLCAILSENKYTPAMLRQQFHQSYQHLLLLSGGKSRSFNKKKGQVDLSRSEAERVDTEFYQKLSALSHHLDALNVQLPLANSDRNVRVVLALLQKIAADEEFILSEPHLRKLYPKDKRDLLVLMEQSLHHLVRIEAQLPMEKLSSFSFSRGHVTNNTLFEVMQLLLSETSFIVTMLNIESLEKCPQFNSQVSHIELWNKLLTLRHQLRQLQSYYWDNSATHFWVIP
ncbi:MAG TPA: hypothetical protein HPP65_02710 [Gammaproteobacteria bacterium]|jgi:hypothetical protein|nr:hypothetical protein [Gammaproteobacteria bacterium]